MEKWHTGMTRLWELTTDEEAIPRNDIALLGINAKEFEVTFGADLPCEALTEFSDASTWAVTLNKESVEFNKEDIILQVGPCHVKEIGITQATSVSWADTQTVRVIVVAKCQVVWIK